MNSGADNTTLNDSNVLTLVGGRKSGASGRRNSLKVDDTLGIIRFNGQTANSATGTGSRSSDIKVSALENFSGSVRGTKMTIRTVNSGTTTESTRLELKNRENIYSSDQHTFYAANGSTQFVTFNTATVTISVPMTAPTLSVTTTATVAAVKFGDGTIQTTAATTNTSFDQTLNTTSNVVFGGVVVNGTIEANTIRKAGYPGLSNMEIQGNLTPQTSGQSDLGAGPSGANKQFGYVYANTGSFTTVVATGIVQFGVYTATALTSITGAVGQMASVSNSGGGGNPNGMMAFWDTTNSRWSYIHDNSAV